VKARICSLPNCGLVHYGLGYCRLHYRRFHKTGDPLGGATPPGSRQRYLRHVVLHYAGEDCLIWPFPLSDQGRAIVTWEGRNQPAARVVCEIVHGPAPSDRHIAAHSCGRGHLGCVSPKHVDWATRAENKDHELIHGTRLRGERIPSSKLTTKDVHAIRALLKADRHTHAEIGGMFGVTAGTIQGINTGKSWGWLL
jgi:hypothetical protein